MALSLKRSHRIIRIYDASQGVRQGRSTRPAARQATPLGTWAGPLGVALFWWLQKAQGRRFMRAAGRLAGALLGPFTGHLVTAGK